MVPPYILLSEANLGLGLLQSAEEFLSMADWSILKTPNCSNAVRSQVILRWSSGEGETRHTPYVLGRHAQGNLSPKSFLL